MMWGNRPTYNLNALVGLVIVLIFVGVLMGVAYAGIEWLNPMTGQARADEMERATAYQTQLDELELEQRRQALTAREEQLRQDAEFREQQHELELAHQRERAALDLKLAPIRAVVLWGAMGLALLVASGGLTYYLISLGQQRRSSNLALQEAAGLRKNMRTIANANEWLANHLEASQQQVLELEQRVEELQQQALDSQQQMTSLQQQLGKVFVVDGNGRQKDTTWMKQ
jgi:hypothetical protein